MLEITPEEQALQDYEKYIADVIWLETQGRVSEPECEALGKKLLRAVLLQFKPELIRDREH